MNITTKTKQVRVPVKTLHLEIDEAARTRAAREALLRRDGVDNEDWLAEIASALARD